MRRALSALLLSVLVVGGCSSDDEADTASSSTEAPATTEAEAEATTTEPPAEEPAETIPADEQSLEDLPFEVAGCEWDPEWEGTGGYTANGTVTNTLGAENEIVVIVRFTTGDVIQGTASELLEPVADGDTVEWAVGEVGENAPADGDTVDCEVLSARQSR